MYYVSIIGTLNGEKYYVENFIGSHNVYFLVISNEDNNEFFILRNNNFNIDTLVFNLKAAFNISGNLKIFDVNFNSIEAVKLSLSKIGIEGNIFGLNLKTKEVFSTTKFGMKLYNTIDYICETSLDTKDYNVPDFRLVSNYVVYEDTAPFEDTCITLDRLVLRGCCVITDDNILVMDTVYDYIKQVYKIIDKQNFSKLLFLSKRR